MTQWQSAAATAAPPSGHSRRLRLIIQEQPKETKHFSQISGYTILSLTHSHPPLPPSLPLPPFPLFSVEPPLSGCTLNRQDVRLTLHYEKGFTVTREPADPAGGAVLFRYPYEKLKVSADDGIRNLYLDFGGPEGEMVRLAFWVSSQR